MCETCGQEHRPAQPGARACKGHRTFETVDGERVPLEHPAPCRGAAMHGQDVCHAHGGKAPQARAAAAKRLAEDQAAQYLTKLGEVVVVDVDPGEQMLRLIAITAAEVEWFRTKAYDLAAKNLIWGRTRKKSGGDDRGTTHEARKNIWLAIYHEQRDKLAALCAKAIEIGLREREVRLAEQQLQTLVNFVDSLLTDLGHDPTDPEVAEVVHRNFTLVAGAA